MDREREKEKRIEQLGVSGGRVKGARTRKKGDKEIVAPFKT